MDLTKDVKPYRSKNLVGYITDVESKPKKGFEFLGQWSDEKGTFYIYKKKDL